MWMTEERRDDPPNLLAHEARRFGYGRLLGIDLPAERAGTVPDRGWRRRWWLDTHDASCAQARSTADHPARCCGSSPGSPATRRWTRRGGSL